MSDPDTNMNKRIIDELGMYIFVNTDLKMKSANMAEQTALVVHYLIKSLEQMKHNIDPSPELCHLYDIWHRGCAKIVLKATHVQLEELAKLPNALHVRTSLSVKSDVSTLAISEFNVSDETVEKPVMYFFVNKDLKMKGGKIAGQTGHSIHYVTQMLEKNQQRVHPDANTCKLYHEWETTGKKVRVLYGSQDHLEELLKLPGAAPVVDAGRTQIAPNSLTVVGFCPNYASVLDPMFLPIVKNYLPVSVSEELPADQITVVGFYPNYRIPMRPITTGYSLI